VTTIDEEYELKGSNARSKRNLVTMASMMQIPAISGELFAKFQTSFYAYPMDAVFKALGAQ
jgi:ATP-dependent Lon protease